MTKQKQKWTKEEEEALSAGVEKYGHGKWKVILSDPQFAPSLTNRSNIDLKDKWRNMNVSGIGSSSREKIKTPKIIKAVTANPPSDGPLSAGPLLEYADSAEPSRRPSTPYYKTMIFEALSTIQDPYGPDLSAICNFIESKYELPENSTTFVKSKLRRLMLTGEVEKVGNRFKLKTASSEPETPPVPTETPEDAARVAARAVAVAENLQQTAIEACQEDDKIAELLEESNVMLKLAQDLHALCRKKGTVLLNP